MPQKLFQNQQTKVRKEPKERKPLLKNDVPTVYYKNFEDLRNKISDLKSLQNWDKTVEVDCIVLRKQNPKYLIPEFTVILDDSLGFTIKVYEWFLPEDHEIYKINKRSLKNVTLSNLLNKIGSYTICSGTTIKEYNETLYLHQLAERNCNNESEIDENSALAPFQSNLIFRVKNCSLLIKTQNHCTYCAKYDLIKKRRIRQKDKKDSIPAKLKAPISNTNLNKIKLRMQQERLKCRQLEQKIENMQKELKHNNHIIDNQLNKDFIDIIGSNTNNVTPFMELFWEQQKRLFSSSESGARYHPMIIRLCLSLAAKSTSAYEEL